MFHWFLGESSVQSSTPPISGADMSNRPLETWDNWVPTGHEVETTLMLPLVHAFAWALLLRCPQLKLLYKRTPSPYHPHLVSVCSDTHRELELASHCVVCWVLTLWRREEDESPGPSHLDDSWLMMSFILKAALLESWVPKYISLHIPCRARGSLQRIKMSFLFTRHGWVSWLLFYLMCLGLSLITRKVEVIWLFLPHFLCSLIYAF